MKKFLDMVRLEQTDAEKITGNTYSATFNIVFASRLCWTYFKTKKSTPDSAVQTKKKFSAIPVKINKKQPIVWEEKMTEKCSESKL